MSTAADRFDGWCEKHPEELDTIKAQAKDLGLTDADIDRQMRGMRHWLAQNEGSKKVNKKAWGRFIGNWLRSTTTRYGGSHRGRRNPTESKKSTGAYEL